MTNGFFLSFEGLDGAGKTTQIRLLADRLRSLGHDVVESVEPGGTTVAREIRRILLDPNTGSISPTAELLLYFAARAQNVDEILRPALNRGAIIISDRFTDSTTAYQGGARQLGTAVVAGLHRIACCGVEPSLTLYLDIDVATSAARRGIPDRMEMEPDSFRQAVRDAYLRIAAAEPDRFQVIDGTQDAATVAARIWQLVAPRVGVHA
jgi:dTMP kinase